MMLPRFAVCAPVFMAVVSVWASPAQADYELCCGQPVKWSTNSIPMKYCPGWSASDIQDITNAAQGWTDLTESAVNLVVSSDASCSANNSENEIWYDNGSEPRDGVLAVALRRYFDVSRGILCNPANTFCCGSACEPSTLIEADIVVFDDYNDGTPITWQLGMPLGKDNDPGPTGPEPWFINVMQHEMGHAIGLEHNGLEGLARMAPFNPSGGWFYNGTSTVQPLPSDRFDANVLYPNASSYSRLYLSNTTRLSGGHSASLDYHPGTNSIDFYPRNLNPYPGLLTNRVVPGDQVEMRFCRGNLGSVATGATTVNVYRSSDIEWQSTDVIMATIAVPIVPAYTAVCSLVTITVPTGTPNGFHWLLTGFNNNQGWRMVRQPRQIRVCSTSTSCS